MRGLQARNRRLNKSRFGDITADNLTIIRHRKIIANGDAIEIVSCMGFITNVTKARTAKILYMFVGAFAMPFTTRAQQTTPINNGVLKSDLNANGFAITGLAPGEINLLLPSQANNGGKLLATDGTNPFWVSLLQANIAGLTIADSPTFAGVSATRFRTQTSAAGLIALEKDGTDGVFTATSVPNDAWREGQDLMRLRLSRSKPDAGGGKDFLITPYEFGIAVEYAGVEEHWVNEFSVHRGPGFTYSGGAKMWVGDDVDGGGAFITARNIGGNRFVDIVSKQWDGSPHGPLRLRSANSEGIYFQTGPDSNVQNNMTVAGYGIFMSRTLYFTRDGTIDIGANDAYRPRDYYGTGSITLGGSAYVAGSGSFNGRVTVGSFASMGSGNFGGTLTAAAISAASLSTGTLSTSSLSTGSVSATGAAAGYALDDRTTTSRWLMFSSGDKFNLSSSTGSAGNSMTLDSAGNAAFAGTLSPASNASGSLGSASSKWKQLFIDQTLTPPGATGDVAINKAAGSVRIAPAQFRVTVTNSLCTANSLVFAVVRSNDATAYVKNVVAMNGSFTVNLGAAANAETEIAFHVINQ